MAPAALAHVRRARTAVVFMSNVAVHKGHLYCVAELYIIQRLEAS